jgi:hypothetical protein
MLYREMIKLRMRWAERVARMGRGKLYTGFCWGNLRVTDHWKGPVIDGRIILSCIVKVGCVGMDWIELAEDRDRWRALVNAVMNLWVPQNEGNFWTSCKPLSFSRRTLPQRVSN